MKKVYFLYCLSGFVSLGYQVCWFRIFVDVFGSTNLTFALVLCNFIGGLGLGALLSKRLSERLSSWLRIGPEQPLRVYGVLELGVSLTVCLTLLLRYLPADLWGTFPYALDADGIYRQVIFYQGSKILAAGACVLLPSLFMGATFPLLCFVYREDKQFPSFLYGWNTLGACSGVLVCEFVFLPLLGHDRTFMTMLVLNAVIGMFFLLWGRATTDRSSEGAPLPDAALPETSEEWAPSVLLACAVLSGFLCGALEGDMFKRLWFLNCTYGAAMSFISFWAILGIFLASWTVRILPRLRFWHIKVAALAALLFYAAVWEFSFSLRDWFTSLYLEPIFSAMPEDRLREIQEHPYLYTLPRKFYNYREGLGSLLMQVGLFVFPAYYLLSFLLPYVCNRVQSTKRHLGMVYGLNTIAFCLGMICFTWIAPAVNIFYSLKLMMGVFVVLVICLATLRPRTKVAPLEIGVSLVALAAAVIFTPTDFDPSYFDSGSVANQNPVRAMRSNAAHTTFVVDEQEANAKWLFFDGHPMSATHAGAQSYMRLMAHYPLLAHPHPKSALLICFGVGNTASAIAAHESIERIDVVDLNDKVYKTAPEFARTNHRVYEDPRVTLIHDDGRNFIQLTDRKYDLVTSEPPPPMQEGVYRLYSKEYYETVLKHLTGNGMMSQWLPAWVMPPQAVDLITSTFVQSFPHVFLFAGGGESFILVGGKSEINFRNIEKRFRSSGRVLEDLQALSIRDPIAMFSRIIKTDEMLREEYAGTPVISDQRHDLASIYHDPRCLSIIPYDPERILSGKELAGNPDLSKLRAVMTNIALLKSYVQDYPLLSLLHTRTREGSEVAYAKADWYQIDKLNEAGLTAMRAGRLAESERHYKDSLAMAEDQLSVLISLASLREKLGDLPGVLEALNKYLVHLPEDGTVVYYRARVLVGLRRYGDALEALRKSVLLLPEVPQPAKLLGDLLATMGKKKEAIAAYDKALSIDSNYLEARQNREKVVQSVSNGK